MPDSTAQIDNFPQSNNSAPADMPSSAPEASASEVTTPPAKDDNLAQNVSEDQIPFSLKTTQTGEIPPVLEQKSEPSTQPAEAPPTPPETQSAQLPPSDPIVTKPEPISESVQTDSA